MRSDWERAERGQYRRIDERALVFYQSKKRWLFGLAATDSDGPHWMVFSEMPFSTRDEAMDYADKHYPMEAKSE